MLNVLPLLILSLVATGASLTCKTCWLQSRRVHKAVIILCHLQNGAAFMCCENGSRKPCICFSNILLCFCVRTFEKKCFWVWRSIIQPSLSEVVERRVQMSDQRRSELCMFLSNHFLSISLTASLFSFEALYIAHICLYKQTTYFLELCLLLLPASLLLSDLPVIHQLRLQRLFACVFTRRLICYDLNLLYQHIVTGVVLQSVCLRSILEWSAKNALFSVLFCRAYNSGLFIL